MVFRQTHIQKLTTAQFPQSLHIFLQKDHFAPSVAIWAITLVLAVVQGTARHDATIAIKRRDV